MMTPEQAEVLGRRLVACKHFRWMPGMLRDDGHRFIGLDATNGEEHGFVATAEEGGGTHWCWPQHLRDAKCCPDPRDPATVGCLLALVREAWRTPDACLYYRDDGWHVGSYLDDSETDPFDTEAEALVAALEAAP